MDEFISNLDALHHIQQEVLRKLTYAQWVSYAQLLPDGMAGNAFNYHLSMLVKHGLILKKGSTYLLSPLGRLVVESMSLESKRFKLRPVCGVLLYLESKNGDVLAYKSTRQSLIDYLGLPFGKLRIGAHYKATAERMILRRNMKLDEITNLHYHGPLNICYEQDEELVCHRTGQIWRGTYTGEPKDSSTENGTSMWLSQSEHPEELRLADLAQLNDIRVDVTN